MRGGMVLVVNANLTPLVCKNTVWFPSLRYLYIVGCPKLCLPPLPDTEDIVY
jgi:hypothetical protein